MEKYKSVNQAIENIIRISQLDDMVVRNEKIKLETGENFDNIEFAEKSILYSIRKSFGIEENSKLYNDIEETFRIYTDICSLNATLGIIYLLVDDNFKKATEKYDDHSTKEKVAVILFDKIFDINEFLCTSSIIYCLDYNIHNLR